MSRGHSGAKLARSVLTRAPHLAPAPNESPAYKEQWRSVVEDFPPDHFRESDRGTLHNYVRATLQLRQAEAEMESRPLLFEKANGDLIQDPLLAIIDKLTRTALALARSLKITPLSRDSRTQVQRDPESEHLKRRLESEEPKAQGIRLAG